MARGSFAPSRLRPYRIVDFSQNLALFAPRKEPLLARSTRGHAGTASSLYQVRAAPRPGRLLQNPERSGQRPTSNPN